MKEVEAVEEGKEVEEVEDEEKLNRKQLEMRRGAEIRTHDPPVWLVLGVIAAAAVFMFRDAWVVGAGMLAAAAVIAALIWRTRRRGFPTDLQESSADLSASRESKLFGPHLRMQIPPYVSGHPIGIVLAIGLLGVLAAGVPEARMFLLGAAGVGTVVGVLLWLRHR